MGHTLNLSILDGIITITKDDLYINESRSQSIDNKTANLYIFYPT